MVIVASKVIKQFSTAINISSESLEILTGKQECFKITQRTAKFETTKSIINYWIRRHLWLIIIKQVKIIIIVIIIVIIIAIFVAIFNICFSGRFSGIFGFIQEIEKPRKKFQIGVINNNSDVVPKTVLLYIIRTERDNFRFSRFKISFVNTN
ncbi:MAG: hypothetical protein CMK92_05715 [Pseudomonas sp.]|nr:hypothetical protein [Pseudomonas sp.]